MRGECRWCGLSGRWWSGPVDMVCGVGGCREGVVPRGCCGVAGACWVIGVVGFGLWGGDAGGWWGGVLVVGRGVGVVGGWGVWVWGVWGSCGVWGGLGVGVVCAGGGG